MTGKKDKDLTIELSPEVEASMAADPELAKAMRELSAIMRQAFAGVQSGQYKSMDDAMEALTGNRPKKIDPETGEEIPGASMQRDMELDDDETE